ncbi:MAG: GDP-mannose 4,6-dehydratase [Deltaproteobacteria bacterium]|nr:GDP-mannose 4,6-dehydratase [Deltaproteobacteria bacterium]
MEDLVIADDPALAPAFWLDRPVFVTGATGLLGSNLCAALVDAGADVIALVRDEVARTRFADLGLHQRVTVVRGALEDDALLTRTVNEYAVDTVFHLGAQTIVGTANRHPRSTFEANVRGTWNVFEAVRAVRTVTRVIFASSDKAYGSHEVLPYAEDAPLRGEHPYDVSKSAADLIAQSYAKSFALPVTITRCGNLFGEGDLNFNRIVPGTIRDVLRGRNPVIRSDGTPIRDYFYVQDAVLAYCALARAMEGQSHRGEAFNFSLEQQVSVLELVAMILEILGAETLRPDVRAEASNEIARQYLSAQKARNLLQWSPRFSLREGLVRTISWYRERLART